ncbi:MAG: hypothetical protein HUU29_07290 [Planctomycetaceae bacterium]|nr:hypothetical protein [Planctomycetaceae bacterium]
MSGIAGHVTRKEGRIVEMPERVVKSLRWLTGIALSIPVIMLLVALGNPDESGLPDWGAILLSILPFGLVITIFVGILRQGTAGITAFAFSIVLMHYFALTEHFAAPADNVGQALALRGIPVIGVLAAIYFLRKDLAYNLRPFWYSMQAMKELQESMMKMRAKRDAKKRGETYDESKVMDAEAVVRAVEAQTGREVPKGMSGITVRPGFRQESKDKSSGSSRKQRKSRKK